MSIVVYLFIDNLYLICWGNSCACPETVFSLGTRRCGRYPPEVRTAIPVDGRFEHIVLPCNATLDHAIIWIEREAEKALDVSGKQYVLV